MSRLTEEMLCACDGCELHYDCDDGTYSECEKRKFYEKVQYYEDLEEQGYKMIDVESVVEQIHDYFKEQLDIITEGLQEYPIGLIADILSYNKAICEIVKEGAK